MSPADNKTLVRDYVEQIINRQRLGSLSEFLAATYLYHAPGGDVVSGTADYGQVITMYLEAFPDLRIVFDDQLVEGDRVATRFTATGTQRGAFLGIAATGRHVTIRGIVISRIANGKIAEEWESVDMVHLLKQLGVDPLAA